MASDSSSFVDKLLDTALAIGTPLARKELGLTSEEQVTDERVRLNRLNGSGPVDGAAARMSPQTIFDFAFGRKPAEPGAQATSGTNWVLIAGLGVLMVVGLILLLRK